MWGRVLVLAIGFGVSIGGGCDCGWLGYGRHPSFPAEARGWQAAGKTQEFSRRRLGKHMKEGRKLFLGYDLQRLFVRQYTKANGPKIVAEVFETSTSEDAFGLFSHHRTGDDVGVGQGSAWRGGRLCLWQGNVFARIAAEQDTPETRAATVRIAQALAGPLSEGPLPIVIRRLPADGLDPDSVRYLHVFAGLEGHDYLPESSVLDLSYRTAVAMGTYRRDGGAMTLAVVRYKNREQAGRAWRQSGRVVLKAQPPAAGSEWLAPVAGGRYVGAAHLGRRLALVFQARTREACQRLLRDAVRMMRDA